MNCPYCARVLHEGYCNKYVIGTIAHTYTKGVNDKETIIFTNNCKPLRFNNFSEPNSFEYRVGYRKVEDFSIFKNKTFEQLVLLHAKFDIFS